MISLTIKNQLQSDFCLACAISSAAEQYVKEECEESYLFAAGKKVSGESLDVSGVSPRNLITAAIEYGVLPKKYAPYSIATHDRDFLANWDNWIPMRHLAVKPFKSSYRIRGFDKVVNILRERNTTIICGLFWQAHWDDSPFITSLGEFNKLTPHEVLLIGEKDGYIVIQNSVGVEKGDKGLCYINKEAFKAVHHTYGLSELPKKNFFLDFLDNL